MGITFQLKKKNHFIAPTAQIVAITNKKVLYISKLLRVDF